MTELEKQEEKYCKESCGSYYYECHSECSSIEAFQAGAKWGMEHAIEWHDLRKNPDDLPKRTGEYFTNIGLLYYDELCNRHFWHTPSCEACDYSDEVEEDEVIAWCELPQFKE